MLGGSEKSGRWTGGLVTRKRSPGDGLRLPSIHSLNIEPWTSSSDVYALDRFSTTLAACLLRIIWRRSRGDGGGMASRRARSEEAGDAAGAKRGDERGAKRGDECDDAAAAAAASFREGDEEALDDGLL